MSREIDYLLIDGSSLLFRAYFALPQLNNSSGEPTGALHGIINMIRNLRSRFPKSLPVVIFDTSKPTFRHEIYPQYKANRESMPEDLASQIKPVHQSIQAMGLPLVTNPGYEADDIIATYSRQAGEHNKSVLIISSDKDLMQLVNDQVHMYDAFSNSPIDRDRVYEKYGVWPEQIGDLLCLTGDKVDNIPGVDKVGPKTAAKWLQQYKTLEEIVSHADEITGKVGEYLRASVDTVLNNRRLVGLDDKTPVELSLPELSLAEQDNEQLHQLFNHYELKRHFDLLQNQPDTNNADTPSTSSPQPAPKAPPKPATGQPLSQREISLPDVELIIEAEQLDTWVKDIIHTGSFAYDCETTGLDYFQDHIVGIALALPQNRVAYLPCAHQGLEKQLTWQQIADSFAPVFDNPKIAMIGQNLKFDLHMLKAVGISPKCAIGDTMLMSYLLNSTAGKHNLTSLTKRWFDYQPVEFEAIVGSGKNAIGFDQADIQQASKYAGEDAWLALELYQEMAKALTETGKLKEVYNNIEAPLIEVLIDMESQGFQLDPQLITDFKNQLLTRLGKLAEKAFSLAGMVFNPDSPKQLGEVLFQHLGLKSKRKTPKGGVSTSEAVLQELAREHELPKLMLEYRMLQKLQSTYTTALIEQIHPKTGRVHSSFHQAVAVTGRLSSTSPNLQNLPIKTEEGRKIREGFVAPKGKKIVSADYSQIELRIMAHLSDDQRLIESFNQGLDIHNATASEIFASGQQPTADQRRAAKAINFGLMYGMSAYGLARNLNISNGEAKDYITRYFSRYPGVFDFMEQTRQQVKDQGYVETIFGRRLYLPGIHSANAMQRQGAERAAINAPMQGTAADLIKMAMIKAHEKWQNSKFIMLLQVHDELVFEVPSADVEQFSIELKAIMEQVTQLKVPLVVDAGSGDNWLAAHG